MSSGWIGPGARGAPQNQEDNANYDAIKAQVEKDEKEKREAENAMRASQGLPPCKCLDWVNIRVCRKLIGFFAVKHSFWSRVKKGVQKALMM